MGKHLPQKDTTSRHLKTPEKKPARQRSTDLRISVREHPDMGLTKRNIIECAASTALFIAACVIKSEGWISLAIFAVPFLVAFYTVLMRAIEELSARDFLDDSIIVIIASVAAFAISDFKAGAAIMVAYRLTKLLEALSADVCKKMYAKMRKSLPDSITVETDTGVELKAPQQVSEGEIFTVEPDEMIALDGVVIDGMSALDASPLTATDENFTVTVGDRVISGCINTDATIRVRAEKIYAESTAARICEMLENAQKYKSDFEKKVEKLVRYYLPIILVAALLIAVIPSLISGEWRKWIGRAVILLVLSGTGMLTSASSIAYLGCVAVCAKNGIVIKGTRFIEAAAKVKTMVFNKTATLTDGHYSVIDAVPKSMSDYELIHIAAAGEQYSDHPIGRAICAACGAFEKEPRENVKTEIIPGKGVSTVVRGTHIYVGNAALLEEHGIHCDIPKRGGAAIHVAKNDVYCGYILVSEKIREGAFDILEELRASGVKNTVLLTGDVRSVARPVASSLNFEMVKSELTQESKVSAVEYLLATKPERSTLAVVSDKANDASSLERADVGISLASLGSDAALNSADVMIMGDDLKRLPFAIKCAKLAYSTVQQNVFGFAVLRLLMIILGLTGTITIFAAVVADLIISILLLGNSYRTVYNKY